MKVLVVEDDVLLLEFIVRCLKEQTFDVDIAKTGDKGYQKARKGGYDVIVLDIMLPNMSGTEVCKKLRDEDIHTPVLFLSANTSKQDRVTGLDIGADDYLVKPFDHEELIARVKALSRRKGSITPQIITYSDLTIDTAKRQVLFRNVAVHLTPKEFQLLEMLARNPETVLSREYLLRHIWGVTPGSSSNRLEVCIRGLRRKIAQAGGNEFIDTEYGVGYKLHEGMS